MKRKKKKILRESEDKVIHIAENVDKSGIFYVVKRMPEKLQKKFADNYDKKQSDWWFDEDDVKRARKIMKKRGYKVKIARLSAVTMSLGDALKEFKQVKLPRRKSKFKPLDNLLGGGFVKGAVTLISGEPGAGKSTLSNQLMLRWSKKVRCAYVNTEENAQQVADRFKRLNENEPFSKSQKRNLIIMVQKDINLVRAALKKEDAEVVILDSLGGFVEAAGGTRGGGRIMKEASGIIHDYVKMNNPRAVAIMVGHVTKKGSIAGPEALQHMADTVLFIQGSARLRTIQPFKNRFGDTGGMISVAMTETGLEFEDSQKMVRDVTPGRTNAAPVDRDNGWESLR